MSPTLAEPPTPYSTITPLPESTPYSTISPLPQQHSYSEVTRLLLAAELSDTTLVTSPSLVQSLSAQYGRVYAVSYRVRSSAIFGFISLSSSLSLSFFVWDFLIAVILFFWVGEN